MENPAKKTRQLALHWCITLNNPKKSDEKLFSVDAIRYSIFGREHFGLKPTTLTDADPWTPHLQGYIVFHKKTTLAACKKIFPTAHFEVKKGTVKQAIDYCKKDGDFVEYGTKPLEQTDNANFKNQEIYDQALEYAQSGRILEINSKVSIQQEKN